MATRGRKPLPTALKALEGDRGKGRRPLNKDEPIPPQNNVKCPPHATERCRFADVADADHARDKF